MHYGFYILKNNTFPKCKINQMHLCWYHLEVAHTMWEIETYIKIDTMYLRKSRFELKDVTEEAVFEPKHT